MCLAVPGEVVAIDETDALMRNGRVRFGAVERAVQLALVPEAGIGDFVLVHAGFAIGTVHREEAEAILRELDSLEEEA
jgi:hydrogenase expression/formation protein HypC